MAELERNIRRGGVYWVRSLDEWGGSNCTVGRPAVIISNDYGNERSPVVNVAFCTTQQKPHNCNVSLSCCEKASQVMCNQIAVVEKGRVANKLGQCSEEEMRQIDEKLAMVLGLTLHKTSVDESLEAAKAQIAGLEEELLAKRVEIAMAEKMYDKALEMLAGVHLTKDLQKKPARVPRIVEDEPEQDEEIENRRGDGGGKVNVNTASWQELNEIGFYPGLAHRISGYRKKHGPYRSLKDLLKVDRFTQYYLDTYGGKLTV